MANVLAVAVALVLIIIAEEGNRGIIMAGAQSPPSPNSSSLSCGASLASLALCSGFLLSGTSNRSPTQGCCTALASIVDSIAVCVCQLFTTTNSPLGIPINNIPLGIPINQNRALALPGACKITTPTLTQCMSAAVGADAPVATPESSPPLQPTASSPSPATMSTVKSPATSVFPSALPPATTGGLLSPSGSQVRQTGSANAGSIMSFSMSSMLTVGLMNIIAARIIV